MIVALKDAKESIGLNEYTFPNSRSRLKPLSDNALPPALRRAGSSKNQMTAHGFRAMARTILDEVLRVRPDFIEHQLAHAVKGPLGAAYNRADFIQERKRMMQAWADYLVKLKTDVNKRNC